MDFHFESSWETSPGRSRASPRGDWALACLLLASVGCAQTYRGSLDDTQYQYCLEPAAHERDYAGNCYGNVPPPKSSLAVTMATSQQKANSSTLPHIQAPSPPDFAQLVATFVEPEDVSMSPVSVRTPAPAQVEPCPLPQMLPAVGKDYEQFVVKTIVPEAELDLIVGLPKILVFKNAPKRIRLEGDARVAVAAYTIITGKELSVVGKKPGRTVLNLWFADPNDPAKEKVLSYLVQVFADRSGPARK
jgi:hypothetical protein